MFNINIINYLFLIINTVIVISTLFLFYHKGNSNNTITVNKLFVIPVILIGAFVRFYSLTAIPYGLQQDEASIAYEAFSLLKYGVDRNLYPYPVYPITWGSGGGSPIMIYLTMLTDAIFGVNVWSLRIVPAFLGVLTLILFYLILLELFDDLMAITGTAFLAICPWHVILSRWSLDSNTVPFWVALALLFFIKATKSQKTHMYMLAAAAFSLCLYSYGSSTIIIPLTILMSCTYAMVRKVLSFKQLCLSFLAFLVVAAPIGYFYMVNYFGLPEIFTSFFSVNKFTFNRIGSVFLSSGDTPLESLIINLKGLSLTLTIGNDDNEMMCNYVPGFATLLKYTFPVTFLGIGIMIRYVIRSLRKKVVEIIRIEQDSTLSRNIKIASNGTARAPFRHDAVILFMLIAALILNLLIIQDINRMVFMFLPLVYFFIRGLAAIKNRSVKLFALSSVITLIGCVMFMHSYFTTYNDNCASIFMPGYGEACQYAKAVVDGDNTDEAKNASTNATDTKTSSNSENTGATTYTYNGTIYSTYTNVSAPYMLALFYTQTSPYEFYDTVVYKDPGAEFRIASAFSNFVFGDIPEDAATGDYTGDVFIISTTEMNLFEGTDYEITEFGNYAVVVPN